MNSLQRLHLVGNIRTISPNEARHAGSTASLHRHGQRRRQQQRHSLERGGCRYRVGRPPEFGGPGDVWSPEGLLVAAVADCFVLTFRGIARTAKLDWLTLDCKAEGKLDKLDGMTQFTEFKVTAELTVPAGANEKKAATILQKAEKYCLITNSMKAESHLDASVIVGD